MRIECPVCHTEGFLQQRGSSYRVQHYEGFKDGKRAYAYHRIDKNALSILEVNGSKRVEVNRLKNNSFNENEWTGRDLNPRPPECKSGIHTAELPAQRRD